MNVLEGWKVETPWGVLSLSDLPESLEKTVQTTIFQVFDDEGFFIGMVEADNEADALSKAKMNKLRSDIWVKEVRYRTEDRFREPI